MQISLVVIVYNEEKNIKNFLNRFNWVDEVVIVNNNSTDKTNEYIKSYSQKIYYSNIKSYGNLKNLVLSKAKGDWILMLDVDELVSEELKKEIVKRISEKNDYTAYKIRYQNYFLGHKLVCRAQRYYKARLFKRGYGYVTDVPLHEEIIVRGKVGVIETPIEHHSFRSIPQIVRKFTYYASVEAPLLYKKGERVSLKKLTMYPAHMFYSIFFEDQGYKDGIWGFGLALSFTYLEFMKYFLLLKQQLFHGFLR